MTWAHGTIKAYRTGYLDSNLPPGGMRWRRKDSILFVQWMDIVDVFLCSTLHTAHGGDAVQRRVKGADGQWAQRDIPVPPAVKEYNRYGGSRPVRCSDRIQGPAQNTEVVRDFLLPLHGHRLHKELARSKGDVSLGQKAFRETLAMELANEGSTTHELGPPSPCHHHRPGPFLLTSSKE
ncbi:uncharacterized protein [Nothobranchius furzeri]|uniref:uncharacterized protein n=1 Tax=Nothobranchius furzeri TaxID=105023 RepID=UPI0039049D06